MFFWGCLRLWGEPNPLNPPSGPAARPKRWEAESFSGCE